LSILAVYEVLACDPGWFFFLFVFQILEGTLKVSWLASLKIEGVEGEGRVKRKKNSPSALFTVISVILRNDCFNQISFRIMFI